MTARNVRQLAEAAARVNTWPTLPADHRAEAIDEVATIIPGRPVAVLSYRGVDEVYRDVPAAESDAQSRGIPYVVARFASTPLVLAESPVLRVL